MKHASLFITNNILSEIPNIVKKPLKDAKSRLQEFVQSKGFPTPKYDVISESGPDHAKQFTVGVVVDNKLWGVGTGKNKSEAAQLAAKKAIESYILLFVFLAKLCKILISYGKSKIIKSWCKKYSYI